MRSCLGCARPTEKARCPGCAREKAAERKAAGHTGERGSTHASRQRRENVLARADNRCFYCTAPADRGDHYIPLAEEGPDTEENMVAACTPCNSAKSDKMPAEFMASEWLADRCEEVAGAVRDGA